MWQDFEWSERTEDRTKRFGPAPQRILRFWQHEGARAVVTDICVPVIAFGRCGRNETRADIAASARWGQFWDDKRGWKFPFCLLLDPENKAEYENALALFDRRCHAALAYGDARHLWRG